MIKKLTLPILLCLAWGTQARADEWFDAHCLESRSIMASVLNEPGRPDSRTLPRVVQGTKNPPTETRANRTHRPKTRR